MTRSNPPGWNAAHGQSKTEQRKANAGPAQTAAIQARRRKLATRWAAGLIVAAVAIAGLYAVFRQSSTNHEGGTGPAYQVGSPGPGQPAPGFRLRSSTGGTVSLSDLRGKTVLLYFQEGLSCQPCWDQITRLESDAAAVKAAGVEEVISLTTDPADQVAQKTRDMGLSTPVLSDPNLAVSNAYHANDFGMMGTARDGHTFVLVGPDGVIRWRADYGGAPNYTMYVPPAQLLAQLKTGLKAGQ
jgi:peroxiredoxin